MGNKGYQDMEFVSDDGEITKQSHYLNDEGQEMLDPQRQAAVLHIAPENPQVTRIKKEMAEAMELRRRALANPDDFETFEDANDFEVEENEASAPITMHDRRIVEKERELRLARLDELEKQKKRDAEEKEELQNLREWKKKSDAAGGAKGGVEPPLGTE